MMSYDEIETMVDQIGIPAAYHHFEVENAINPPFICWLIPGSNNFSADGVVYHEINILNIELYTDKKDLECEKKVEDILNQNEIFWEKFETYIESENLYEVLYEMEV